jgi:hypothetical protein
MRMLRSLGVILGALALAANLSAGSPEKTKTHGFSVSGTVARTDDSARTFVVKTSAGKETTLLRTAATKVNGESLRPGDRVAVRYLERDGKKIATSIRIDPPAVAAATPTAPAPSTR